MLVSISMRLSANILLLFKPRHFTGKVETTTDEAVDSLITSTEERVPACGSDYYDAAGNCGAVCPNGHSDCLSGEFCWHVECGATPPVTSTTSTAYSGPMLSKYQVDTSNGGIDLPRRM